MNDTITVRALSVGVTEDAAMLRAFLAHHALGFEADIDAAFGVFDEDEVLRGCGCAFFGILRAGGEKNTGVCGAVFRAVFPAGHAEL